MYGLIKKLGITILILVCLAASWSFIGIVVFGINFVKLNLVGDDEIYINVNEKYFENGYKAEMLSIDVNDQVVVENNINSEEVGTYEVRYQLSSTLGMVEKVRKVHVVDEVAPVIKILGDSTIYLRQNAEYVEYGYTVYDNFDHKLATKVEISSNVDSSKIGKYEVNYKVSDSSGNVGKAVRYVEVIKNDLLTSPPELFRFDNMYSDIIIKPDNEEYHYINDMVIVGDSNIRYLYVHGKYLPANQVWGKDNLNAVELTTSPMLIHSTNEQILMNEALTKYKPKYLVVSFGFGSVMNLSKNNFIKYAEIFINNVKDNYPDTKLLIVSLLPISTGTMYSGLQNKTNQFNYYLVELCAKHKISFINIADELKGKDGYGDPQYFVCAAEYDCGFHLNDKGKSLYVDYLKKIDMSKEIK
ncbi:MAG: DUF5011 domain-containing protein [Bacilli bacterium]|nr:DUF5011 domain-containing protein [Bacilli bacterium]